MEGFVFLSLLIFSSSIALASSFQRSNEYLDYVIKNRLADELRTRHLNPAPLKDFKMEYHTKITFVNVKVKAEFDEGKLKGLDKGHRLGNCEPPTWRDIERNQATLSCSMAFNELEVKFHGKAKYSRIPKANFDAKAKVDNVVVRFAVTMDRYAHYPKLVDFRVDSRGAVATTLSSLGSLLAVRKSLKEHFTSKLPDQIEETMQNAFKSAIESAILNGGAMPLPIN